MAAENGSKSSHKEAALIVLRRAAAETEPVVMAALVQVAITQVEQIQELVRARKPRRPVTTAEAVAMWDEQRKP